MDVHVTTKVSFDEIANLLCSGFEGGIGYWAMIVDYKEPPAENITEQRIREIFSESWARDLLPDEHGRVCRYILYPLTGGSVILEDVEEDNERYELNYESIVKGLQIMAQDWPRHFSDFVRENFDATTGDVFIQCCLFGKIVYG